MKIQVQRSGGFAGLTDTVGDVDTAGLAKIDAEAIERLADALEAGYNAAAQPVGADFVKYQVTLTRGTQQRMLTFADDGTAKMEPVRRLLEQLSAVAPGGKTPKR